MANKDRNAVENGLNDILGSVIRTDQLHSGRGQRLENLEENPTEPLTPVPQASPEILATARLTEEPELSASPATRQSDAVASRAKRDGREDPVAASERKTDASLSLAGSSEKDRVEEAQIMAKTPTMTVTLRIPQGLNEWLDQYVHLSWPQKIRKQELVIEALRMLYARRGNAGEEIVITDLLGEE